MSTRIPSHVVAYLQAQPWAMHQPTLRRMAQVVLRDPAAVADMGEAEPSASVSWQAGEPHETARATVRGGVATISVCGPLMRYADWFSLACGGCTYEQLGADIGCLLADPSITAIVLDIDSPGGELNGCQEVASLIHAGTAHKPIIACITGLGCSAAYWIAAACSEVVAVETAIVGSLGVRFLYTADAAADATTTEIDIVSSQTPGKAQDDPTTPEGLANVQRLADELGAVFLAHLSELRGTASANLLAATYDGNVVTAAAATPGVLFDRIVTAETLQDELQASPTLHGAPHHRGSMSSKQPPARAAAYEPEATVRALVARTVIVEEGAIGVVKDIAEGVTAYAVEFPDGTYQWLAEAELALADGETPTAPAEEAVTDDADEAAAMDEEKDYAPAARSRATIERAAAHRERRRVLAILKIAGGATAEATQLIRDGKPLASAAVRLAQVANARGRLAHLQADDKTEQAAAMTADPHSQPTGATATAASTIAVFNRSRGGK